MKLDSTGYVSIVELIVFVPALIASIIVCARHGFGRASGWIYTSILCLVRIGGAICQLLSYSNHSTGLITATLIFDSIGLSPLLFATLGLICRLIDGISNAKGKQVLGIAQVRAIQLLILLAMILGIVGGTDVKPNASGAVQVPATSKAAVILYLVAFIGVSVALCMVLPHRGALSPREQRTPIVVAVALPLILVRILYSIIAAFANNKHFSIYNGSVGIRVGMAIVEEFVVVVMYIILGFTLEKLQGENRGELAHRVWKLSERRARRRF